MKVILRNDKIKDDLTIFPDMTDKNVCHTLHQNTLLGKPNNSIYQPDEAYKVRLTKR